MRAISVERYVAMPWANGRGTTLEIARWPLAGDWDWRLSLATVETDGPFSSLPGVDRALVVASGMGMDLEIDGASQRVSTHGGVQFRGEAATVCALVSGPVVDLNLMARRGSCGHPCFEVTTIERGEPIGLVHRGFLTSLTVLSGSITMTATAGRVPTMELAHDRDTILLDPGDNTTVSSPRGAVVAIGRVTP